MKSSAIPRRRPLLEAAVRIEAQEAAEALKSSLDRVIVHLEAATWDVLRHGLSRSESVPRDEGNDAVERCVHEVLMGEPCRSCFAAYVEDFVRPALEEGVRG